MHAYEVRNHRERKFGNRLKAPHKDAVNILGKALTDARTALEQASSEDSQQRFVKLSVFMLCVWYLVPGCFGFCYASFDFLRETLSKDWDHNDEGHAREGSNSLTNQTPELRRRGCHERDKMEEDIANVLRFIAQIFSLL